MDRLILILILAAGALSNLNAETETGSLSEAVTDDSRAAVPAGGILVTDLGTRVERTVISDEAGLFVVNALPAGQYSVSFLRDGFTYKVSAMTRRQSRRSGEPNRTGSLFQTALSCHASRWVVYGLIGPTGQAPRTTHSDWLVPGTSA
jgi:hypothetical protein